MSHQPDEPLVGQHLDDPDTPLAASGAAAADGQASATGPHPHGPEHPDPVLDEVEAHTDPAVVALVHEVRDRFGARGLRDAITLATYELELAEQAAAALSEIGDSSSGGRDPGAGVRTA